VKTVSMMKRVVVKVVEGMVKDRRRREVAASSKSARGVPPCCRSWGMLVWYESSLEVKVL